MARMTFRWSGDLMIFTIENHASNCREKEWG
jgi:hypothetical protein